MTILITGGNGFVMSNLVLHWLAGDPGERAVILDSSAPDPLLRRFLAPVLDRVDWVQASILEPQAWAPALAGRGIDRVVHGATVTPHAYVAADGTRHDPEREDPRRILEVNLMGTVALLDWARAVPGLARFLLVSTGSVYGDEGPAIPGAPLPEEGYVAPTTLYGISKHAAELATRRYGEIYGLPATAVRLASVYGPMDRYTAARHVRCLPWRVAHLALAGEELRAASTEAVGDWIHAGDVATAIALLLRAPAPRHPVYNVGSGRAETIGGLIAAAREVLPLTARETAEDPNLPGDPARRGGQWGAYDIGRLRDELGWQPAPLRQRLREYIDWIRAFEPETVRR
ncbi:MAG: NAD(P)-dependent oxidoreductase [Dongiaceae bacterium]